MCADGQRVWCLRRGGRKTLVIDEDLVRDGRVARIASNSEAPYLRRNSGDACEAGATRFGHPVQHADTNPSLRFLVLNAARF
jgi:hypothetical protein